MKICKKIVLGIKPRGKLEKHDCIWLSQSNGTWVRNAKEKADMLADHLANVFKPFPQTVAEEIITIEDRDDK